MTALVAKTMLNLLIILFVHSLQSWGLNLDFVLIGEAVYHSALSSGQHTLNLKMLRCGEKYVNSGALGISTETCKHG